MLVINIPTLKSFLFTGRLKGKFKRNTLSKENKMICALQCEAMAVSFKMVENLCRKHLL